MAQIDLTELTEGGQVRNLSGHLRGVAARQKFQLDALDQNEGAVTVHVPADLYALSSSFFQGMFAESVKRSGSREGFLRKYNFDAPAIVLRQIDSGISASLMPRDRLV